VANLVGSFLGSFIVFGSLPRSRILYNAGGVTNAAGFMSGFFVLLATTFLVPLLQYLPLPTLAAIVFVAAYNLIEWKELQFIFKNRNVKEMMMVFKSWIILYIGVLLLPYQLHCRSCAGY
jgi:SulP family sulfate permease